MSAGDQTVWVSIEIPLEDKATEVRGWRGRDAAWAAIDRCRTAFAQLAARDPELSA